MLPLVELSVVTQHKEENEVMETEASESRFYQNICYPANQSEAATFISCLSSCPLVCRLQAPLLLRGSSVTFGYYVEYS